MKKTLKIVLVVITLVLSLMVLTACGESKENNNVVNNEVVGQENDLNQNDLSQEETTNNMELSRGKWTDNVYTNEFADIKFTLPEGWSYQNDEEIATMMNIGTELLNEDQQKLAEIAEQTGLYDMVANSKSSGSSVMVIFEKPLLDVNVEYYFNSLKQGLEAIEAMNYEISDEITTETLGGKEYSVLTVTVPTYNMVQKYYVVKEGDYFVDILITYVEGLEDVEDIISNFE